MGPFKDELLLKRQTADSPLEKEIYTRDYYATFFPEIVKEWNQDDLNELTPSTFKVPYSPIFINYLFADVPDIMSKWTHFIRRKPG